MESEQERAGLAMSALPEAVVFKLEGQERQQKQYRCRQDGKFNLAVSMLPLIAIDHHNHQRYYQNQAQSHNRGRHLTRPPCYLSQAKYLPQTTTP